MVNKYNSLAANWKIEGKVCHAQIHMTTKILANCQGRENRQP